MPAGKTRAMRSPCCERRWKSCGPSRTVSNGAEYNIQQARLILERATLSRRHSRLLALRTVWRLILWLAFLGRSGRGAPTLSPKHQSDRKPCRCQTRMGGGSLRARALGCRGGWSRRLPRHDLIPRRAHAHSSGVRQSIHPPLNHPADDGRGPGPVGFSQSWPQSSTASAFPLQRHPLTSLSARCFSASGRPLAGICIRTGLPPHAVAHISASPPLVDLALISASTPVRPLRRRVAPACKSARWPGPEQKICLAA